MVMEAAGVLGRLCPPVPQFTLTEHGSCCLASPDSRGAQSSRSVLGARLNTPEMNILDLQDCFLNADLTTSFSAQGGRKCPGPAACSPKDEPGSEGW